MRSIRKILYLIQYDFTRNRWISNHIKSNYYGIILMFHHVTDDFIETEDSCKCTVTDFCSIIDQYISNDFLFVSMDEAMKIVREKEKKRFVVVTFDDIPENVYKNAYPILKEKGIPFTVFITYGFIGKDSFINHGQMMKLNSEPLCTIGAHTITHPILREEKNSRWEIEQSKKELENLLNKKIKYFAYPYGRYESVSRRVVIETRNSGFDCAFCTIIAPLTEVSSRNMFFLPRVVPKVGVICEFERKWTVISVIKKLLRKL